MNGLFLINQGYRSAIPAPLIDTVVGGHGNGIQILAVSNAGGNDDQGNQSVGVVISVVHLGIDLNALGFVSGGGASLQPLIKLRGQVAEFAGGAVVEAVGKQ